MTSQADDRVSIGFDPGRDKCGIAVVRENGNVLEAAVVPSEQAIDTLKSTCRTYRVDRIVIGDRTTSKQWERDICEALPDLEIARINEHNSTLEARDRYWKMNPPRGLSRIIPQGMRVPPRPIDDIVAILLVERYLSRH
ncbi:resolvase [Leptolyngbya valderiana BDU 20041]|uniref:pre-16S rRNA-processing nuclease YqgF n=1 Tax=Baaleninema simplex TaxID=2862350 RepID=UPI000345AB56|nr:pre-16S rRNA-processing nuclease YqgF [Baaleninema simplex]MDC0834742.1 pre-16S rRNA-processing nuclease YqgF [Geitlerinema sp. CS-897]OAB54926.1 resolvase [Leptolyngbya valderiana BDU 20041]